MTDHPQHTDAPALDASDRKSFAGDLHRLVELLRARRPFAFSRFGDGEWTAMRNVPLDYTQKANGEFRFSPEDEQDQQARRALIDSFHYSAPGYFAGIGCECCWGRDKLLQLRKICIQPETNLTWANLWGNANYPAVRREVIPLFRGFSEVTLVCHERADPSRLPFRVTRVLRVGANAWTRDFALADEITDLATTTARDGALFLFSAGPLANILAWRGHAANPRHTWLDTGSILDPWLFARKQMRWLDWFPGLIRSPGITRGYLKPGRKRRHVCTWWRPDAGKLAAAPLELPADMQPAKVRRAG